MNLITIIILINSFILMDLKTVLGNLEGGNDYKFIIKKDINTTVYSYGQLTKIADEHIELEAYINYCMNTPITLFNKSRSASSMMPAKDDLKIL